MQNHYEILSVNSSATEDEIRRAYRILARRYHPDVNPGKDSEEKFKAIAEAYAVLKNAEQRKQFDIDLQHYQRKQTAHRLRGYAGQQRRRATERYYKAQKSDYDKLRAWQNRRNTEAKTRPQPQPQPAVLEQIWNKRLKTCQQALLGFWKFASKQQFFNKKTNGRSARISKISIVEVSVSVRDVIEGVRKTIEIEEPEGIRKINVRIPAGTKNGGTVRLRASNAQDEEIVLILRVADHPCLNVEAKGLCLEVPITVSEAISGATIKVPTLEEPVMLKVPAGTQSGTELRLRGKGIKSKDRVAGDLFVRLMVRVPESDKAVGIKEKAADLDQYYEEKIRINLPKNLSEL